MPVALPPTERAPLLRVFGSLAPQVAALVRLRPSLALRLLHNPPEAMHSLAAYLHHGVPLDLSDAQVAEINEERHPRILLARTFPNAPSTLYRAMSRSEDHACEPKVYLRAAALATGPFAAPFLAGDPLDASRLAHYEALTTADPVVARLHRVLPEDCASVEAVNSVVSLLRAYGALKEADLDLPPSAGKHAVLRRLMGALDGLRAPALPFVVPAPYRLIESIGVLRRESLRLKNCLRDRWHGPPLWLGLARGDHVFIVGDEPAFVAQVCRVASGIYHLSHITGVSNGMVDYGTRQALRAALRRAGANLVETDPACALSRLNDRLGRRRPPAADADHLIEGDEIGMDEDGDDLAA